MSTQWQPIARRGTRCSATRDVVVDDAWGHELSAAKPPLMQLIPLLLHLRDQLQRRVNLHPAARVHLPFNLQTKGRRR